MFSWLEKDIPIAASVLFRGTWPCNKESFYSLRERGIEVTERETPENGMWAIKLRHPQWGEAVVMCLRDYPLPPADLVDWDANLSDEEKAEFKAAGNAVSVMVNSRRNHLLRDRKNALFFINAVLGEEGVGALDHLSQRMWSRAALKAETSHNADADVQSLFTIHFVASGGPAEENGEAVDLLADDAEEKPETRWLHTHGLSEIGLFDFDIINPSDSALHPGVDVVRAVAYAILEGKLKQGSSAELFSNSGQILAVPAKEFMAKAAPEWSAIREDPGSDHIEDRVVLCETPPNRWFGRIPSQIRPAKCLREDFPDDAMVYLSESASTLMAERARATYDLFRELRAEVGQFGDDIPCLVKIGYQVDNSKKGDEREHLWFQVHEAREKEVDATLMNQPFAIKRMKEGDRGVHSIEGMSDWQVMTPAGPINPREIDAVPLLRKALEVKRTEGSGAK